MEFPPHDDYDDLYLPPQPPKRTSIPKTVGILNIIFGSLLLLCGVCCGWLQSSMASMTDEQQKQFQQQFQQAMEDLKEQKMQELQALERAAKDERKRRPWSISRRRFWTSPCRRCLTSTSL